MILSMPSPEKKSATIRRSSQDHHAFGKWWKAFAVLVANDYYINLCNIQITNGDEKHLWTAAIESENSFAHKKAGGFGPRSRPKNELSRLWILCEMFLPGPHGCEVVTPNTWLVTCGAQHHHQLDYYKTFSAIVKFTTLRFVLDLIAEKSLGLHQGKLKTAFLREELDEGVFYGAVCGMHR